MMYIRRFVGHIMDQRLSEKQADIIEWFKILSDEPFIEHPLVGQMYSERARMVAGRSVDISLTETEIDMLQNTLLLAGVNDHKGTIMEKLRQSRLLLRKDF